MVAIASPYHRGRTFLFHSARGLETRKHRQVCIPIGEAVRNLELVSQLSSGLASLVCHANYHSIPQSWLCLISALACLLLCAWSTHRPLAP